MKIIIVLFVLLFACSCNPEKVQTSQLQTDFKKYEHETVAITDVVKHIHSGSYNASKSPGYTVILESGIICSFTNLPRFKKGSSVTVQGQVFKVDFDNILLHNSTEYKDENQ